MDLLERGGALPLQADAADPEQLGEALAGAAAQIGPLDLIVNAVSAIRPPDDGSGFGGGPLISASMPGLRAGPSRSRARRSWRFKVGARALQGRGGTFVQVVGAPARRANPERGLMAAGGAAVRAITHAAAQELRAEGIHVALLIVDGIIASPKTAPMSRGMAPEALVRQEDVIEAVCFLAAQSARGMTHELVITPAGDRWLP